MVLFHVFKKKENGKIIIETIDTPEEYKEECKKIVSKLIENFLEYHEMEKKHLTNFIKFKKIS